MHVLTSNPQQHPVTLRFLDPDLEAAFLGDYVTQSLKQVRWALLLGIALYSFLFGLLDLWTNAPQRYEIWMIRAGVFVLGLGVFSVTFTEPFKRFMQSLLGLGMLVAGLGAVGMIAVDQSGAYYDGPALLVLAGYVMFRLRFIHATVVGWIVILAYAAVVIGVEASPSQVLRSSSVFLIAANIIGMYAGYMLEANVRTAFWQARLISERNRIELENARELVKAYEKLKATQAQLIQQEKMASLGQLTAGIAHQIKNPLNFVNNFAELNKELAEELAEALDQGEDVTNLLFDLKQNAAHIAKHGQRANGIIRSMLEHARTQTGERRATDINALLEQYLALAYHGMHAGQPEFTVELERDYDEAVGKVEVVPQEISRVFLNLLNNAFNAVHESAVRINGPYLPTVTVSTRQLAGQVEIRVCDNGPGIPAAIQEKIFEPFFTTKPAGTGTGLGLSLSYDIVTQGHGGTLTVESTEGEGATFVITLPSDSRT